MNKCNAVASLWMLADCQQNSRKLLIYIHIFQIRGRLAEPLAS